MKTLMKSVRPIRLRLQNITKTFPGVVANDRITLDLRPGEIHALLGENGAGKTTLMRILYGLYQPDDGEILMRGQPVRIRSPRQAIALGMGLVPQQFLLVRQHTVVENIALGLLQTPFFFPLRRLEQHVRDVGAQYGLHMEPRAPVWQLSPGEQQRVEILKALLRGGDLLILDEPTALLTPQEVSALFDVLRRLQAGGHTIVFITHKLNEVMAIADVVTVLRQGRVVATLPTSEATPQSLARLMIGRDVVLNRLERAEPHGTPNLRVEQLWVHNDRGTPALRGISFLVRTGEIFGVTGVSGNGQRELVEALTGLRRPAAGRIQLGGQDITGATVRHLYDHIGLAHIPEDRYHMGIVSSMSVAENFALKHYRTHPMARGPWLNRRAMAMAADRAIHDYAIATPHAGVAAGHLSGGNIQKLILAREFAGQPRVVVASHPTHGLDVGATARTHELLMQQRQQGATVLLVSEDLEEVMRLSDRILVLCGGDVAGMVPAATATPEQLGMMMAGVMPPGASDA
jgi:ABC-type uncharacterized transport system ATPase subunit